MDNRHLPRLARWGGLLVFIIALGLPALPIEAGEMRLKGRNVQSKAESSWKQIGDDESHGIGAYEGIGLTLHESGEVSSYVSTGNYDWNHGSDRHWGYIVRTYSDGSTTTSSYQGTAQYGSDSATWEGTFVYIAGTGRFAGIEGSGTYTGQRYPNKMSISDWEATITLAE